MTSGDDTAPDWAVGLLATELVDADCDVGAAVAVATGAGERAVWKWLARHVDAPALVKVAANPYADPIALRLISRRGGEAAGIDAALAANPNTPTIVLKRLSRSRRRDVIDALEANPTWPR